jgi:NADH-quinone oxidoreductase subunit M
MLPILSLIVFIPLVAGLAMLLMPADKREWIRRTALAASGLNLILTVIVYFSYNVSQGGYQMVERLPWLPALGISYYVGIDGLSAAMLLMAGVVVFCGVLISWNVEDRGSFSVS